jgi:D-3-phosphoglycerate dehydrogenase
MSDTLVLTERLPEIGMAKLAAVPGLRLVVLPEPSAGALAAALPDADGVVLVMEEPRLTAALIETAPRLRIAARLGAGYDNFDVPALSRRGIPLVTTGAANADAVAEQALYLMLALAKRGPYLDRETKRGRWLRGFGSAELRDKTCLIVGYGRIGREIAKRAAAFSMHVQIVDPACAPGSATPYRLRNGLYEALPDADFVVLACSLSPQTRGLIGDAAFTRMRRHAFLVNIARGPVIDENALVRALDAEAIGGAGLDVFMSEPLPANHALSRFDNVVLTPHTAAYIKETFDRVAVVCVEHVVAGLNNTLNIETVVNASEIATTYGTFPTRKVN